MPSFDFIHSGLRTVRIESDAVTNLSQRIDHNFSKACELILNCPGRIIVTGMGKSGHIGKKIAATLASTGTPAFFCASRRGQPRRSWDDYQARYSVGHFLFRHIQRNLNPPATTEAFRNHNHQYDRQSAVHLSGNS